MNSGSCIVKHQIKHCKYTLCSDKILLKNDFSLEGHLKLKELVFVIFLEALDVGTVQTDFTSVLVDTAYAVNKRLWAYHFTALAYTVKYFFNVLFGVHSVYHINQNVKLAEAHRSDMACKE